MALTTQTVPVVFSGGLDQKTAEQLTIPGKFLVLDNCVRRKFGRIEKRPGFVDLSKEVVGRSNVSNATAFFKFNDDVLQVANNRLNSYLSSQDQWADRGSIGILNTSVEQIIRNSHTQSMSDIVSYDGRVTCAWQDSRGGIRVSVSDEQTGATIFYDQEVTSTGTRPKVIGINGKILIIYYRSSGLRMKQIDSQNPTALSAEIDIDTSVIDAAFDVEQWNGTYALLVYRKTVNDFTVCYLLSDGTIGSGATALPSPATVTWANGNSLTVSRAPDEDYIYVLASNGTANQTKLYGFQTNLLTYDDLLVKSYNVTNATIGAKPGGLVDAIYEIDNVDDSRYRTEVTKASFDGTTLTAESGPLVISRQVGLAAKAFVIDSYTYVTTAHQSPLQSTYFVFRLSGTNVATHTVDLLSRNLAGLGGGHTTSPGLPRVTGNYFTSLQVKNKLTAQEDTILAENAGLAQLKYTFDGISFSTSQLGQNLHIASGGLLSYDGVSVTEHGFNLFPEGVGYNPTTGGTLPAGTYYYHVVYEWSDNKGQLHRSAPSIQSDALSVGASGRVIITIPTLTITSKVGSSINAVVYRSPPASAGQIFYRVGSVANSISVDTVEFIDTGSISNSDVLSKEVLYTTGGVIENIAPPACTNIVLHRNRLFLGGLEEKGFIAYSKEYVFGEGVAFSDIFKIPVDPASGNVTALASMDEKLVIFKKDRTYTLVGDGPLDTGAQDDFSKPQLISGDIGCDNPSSIVSVPEGLMFKSDKGIYLLNRNLTFEYVGGDVENFNNLNITSAVLIEDQNEARFTSSDGQALVYNFYFKQWSTFSNYSAVGAITGLGSYLHLKADGTVRKETPTSYLDAGSRIAMTIETSWLAFAGVQNYQRVKEWMLLGDFISDHYTKVELFYDYESFSSETVYFNVDEGLDLSYYGDDAVYGDSEVYGGTGSGVFQFTSVPRKQKCQSVKLRISDIDTKTVAGGGSFNLVGLTFEVGQKQGLTKQLLGNKTVGS